MVFVVVNQKPRSCRTTVVWAQRRGPEIPPNKTKLTVQIGGDTRREKTARCHGERTTKVDHAGEGAAVEDVETVLLPNRENQS